MVHKKAIELIKHYESLHDGDKTKIGLQPKACPAGFQTIGWGHVVIDPLTNKPVMQSQRALELYPGITIEQAEEFLKKDLAAFEAIVRSLVRTYLNEEQYGALVSFCYNIGQGNFAKSDALRQINNKQHEKGTDAMMNWKSAKQPDGTLKVLPGLVARRKSEQTLFLTGVLKFYN